MTEASFSPPLIKLKSTLFPVIKPRLSSKIDLPVPVSPDKTERPFLNSILRDSIRTMFLTINSLSIFLFKDFF